MLLTLLPEGRSVTISNYFISHTNTFKSLANMKKLCYILSLTVLIFHSCGKRGGHQMTFGNPTVVTSFANTMTLDVGDAETLDIVGPALVKTN